MLLVRRGEGLPGAGEAFSGAGDGFRAPPCPARAVVAETREAISCGYARAGWFGARNRAAAAQKAE